MSSGDSSENPLLHQSQKMLHHAHEKIFVNSYVCVCVFFKLSVDHLLNFLNMNGMETMVILHCFGNSDRGVYVWY